jgi:hypothetical protein
MQRRRGWDVFTVVAADPNVPFKKEKSILIEGGVE